jgi:hypothetical protein
MPWAKSTAFAALAIGCSTHLQASRVSLGQAFSSVDRTDYIEVSARVFTVNEGPERCLREEDMSMQVIGDSDVVAGETFSLSNLVVLVFDPEGKIVPHYPLFLTDPTSSDGMLANTERSSVTGEFRVVKPGRKKVVVESACPSAQLTAAFALRSRE